MRQQQQQQAQGVKKRIKLLTILLLLLAASGSNGCLSQKLMGFQEATQADPEGFQAAVVTDEGARFVKSLGLLINKYEEQLEKGN
jgi:hypothetical protein